MRTRISSIIDIHNFLQVAWYTPGRGRHSSSGWIEERLRNVRRSYAERASSSTASSTSTLLAATLPGICIRSFLRDAWI